MTDTMNQALRATKKEVFLADYAKHGVIGHAAKAADVHRRTILKWRESDEDFDEACKDAFDTATDAAEFEFRLRGVDGREELMLHRGEPIPMRDPSTGLVMLDDDFEPVYFTRTVRSDRILEVYVRSHKPIYKEKSAVELTGAGGVPLNPAPITVTYVLPKGKTEADYEAAYGADGVSDPLED